MISSQDTIDVSVPMARWARFPGLKDAVLHGLAVLTIAASSAGCGDRENQARLTALLESAESIELYSLAASADLLAFTTKHDAVAGTEQLHGWKVLGRVSLSDVLQREKLTGDFVAATECYGPLCSRPSCFQPRHAIRVQGPLGTTDLVICFECRQAQVHGKGVPSFTLGSAPEAGFDALLRAARVVPSRELERRRATPTPLFAAASAGDHKAVLALLGKGARPDEPWQGRSPLREAAWLGHHEVIRVLLDAGARLEGDPNKRTPLQEAAQGGHLEAVKLLVRRGASIGANAQGDTALHLATYRGNAAVVAYLLDNGADPNAPNTYHGRTALHIATTNGDEATVRLLLSRGADPAYRSRLNQTPLEEAREAKHRNIVRLLESGQRR